MGRYEGLLLPKESVYLTTPATDFDFGVWKGFIKIFNLNLVKRLIFEQWLCVTRR